MSMTPKEKRIFGRVATGTVAVLLALFAVKECRDGKAAAAKVEEANTEKLVEAECAYIAEQNLARAYDTIDSLVVKNQELKDSLYVVSQDLTDCRNGKTVAKKDCLPCQKKGNTATKRCAVTKKSVSATKPAAKQSETKTSQSSGDVNVTLGCGTHDNTITIDNSTVNNYYGNAAVADTVKRVITGRVRFVSKQTVPCR